MNIPQINIKEQYEEKIIGIWKVYKSLPELNQVGFEYRKYPTSPLSVKKGGILFIGINPSYTIKDGTLPKETVEFYSDPSLNQIDIQYFAKFKEIADYCNSYVWSHLDLLFIRETDQNVIKGLTNHKQGIDFINAQLIISFEIINNVQPDIIVVTNALATEFFGKKKKIHFDKFDKIWLGHDLDFEKDFDEVIGTYKIAIGNRETPIIFSGMLSGQRALDNGSFERLKWQIKRILTMNK
ncbi:MAG: hypothetical protein RBR97_20915 [Bacteroidales bacterium]|jgi:hypothetical protein|nr:hypothetical protein [Bacteroidales bacterium]